MKLQYVSAKENPIGIRYFIEKLLSDYLLTKKDHLLEKTDLMHFKRDKLKIDENTKLKEIHKKELDNIRKKVFYLENLNNNYIKNLTKYNNY